MKKVILALFLFVCVCAGAETIDTVTFNPARLGQYERLKVSDGLTSHGGVQAQSMAVQSNGGVTLENESNYHIPQAQINGSLNMPSTRFETPKLNSRGGTAYFDQTAGTDIQSHIDTLTQTALRVKANVLEAGEAKVNGVASSGYDGDGIQGLKLGGNDIPKREGCSGLDWVERTDAQGNTYKMLGMRSCASADTQCTASYGPSKTTDTYMRDTCPGFDPNSSYTCSNFSQSCVDVQRILQAAFAYSGQGHTASDSEQDTCNGDRENKFPTSPSSCPNSTCRDVYAGKSESPTVSAEAAYSWKCDGGHFTMSGGISPYGYEPFYPGKTIANVKVVYNQNLYNVNTDVLGAQMCAMYGNDGIHDTIMVSQARSQASCSNTDESPGYFRMIKCPKPTYYYQDGNCKQTVNYREVNCCANQ